MENRHIALIMLLGMCGSLVALVVSVAWLVRTALPTAEAQQFTVPANHPEPPRLELSPNTTIRETKVTLFSAGHSAPDNLRFVTSGITINMKTGEVTIPENLTLSEASIEFWEAVMVAFPQAKQQMMEDKK